MHSTKSNVILYNFSQVSELWRTSYKLTKEFAHPEFRGPLRVASTVKARLENFKVNMPLINALCTPGIKDRHWEAMSVKVRWVKKSQLYTSGAQILVCPHYLFKATKCFARGKLDENKR